jgi:uncharacterized SAM-binding protein YcdF (DUF218 family)
MFFVASKLVGFVIQPLNLIALFLLIGLIASLFRLRRLALLFPALALFILVVSAWTSTGSVLLEPLEDRFARPAVPPEKIRGVIVLGGFFEGGINLVRHGYELNDSGDRIVEAAILARRYPDAEIVVTGGNGSLMLAGEGDAVTAPRLLEALGVPAGRLRLETRSRNTYENAVFTKKLIQPKPGEKWLLVTSAFHMPRSMALFRKAGFDVVAWPTDYRTAGDERLSLARDNAIDCLQNTTLAIREWVGLAAYWFSGKIDSFFPSPDRLAVRENGTT